MFETTKRFPFFNAARRPDSSNISPIVQVVSSMDGHDGMDGLKGANGERGESCFGCSLCRRGRAGQIPGQAKQQWNFDSWLDDAGVSCSPA